MTPKMTATEQRQWLEERIREAATTAKREGLPGDKYSVELFGSQGRIFNTEVEHTSGKWHCPETNFPETNGQPLVLKLTSERGRVFEIALEMNPHGTLIPAESERKAAVA